MRNTIGYFSAFFATSLVASLGERSNDELVGRPPELESNVRAKQRTRHEPLSIYSSASSLGQSQSEELHEDPTDNQTINDQMEFLSSSSDAESKALGPGGLLPRAGKQTSRVWIMYTHIPPHRSALERVQPFTVLKPRVCLDRLDCNSIRLGVGRKGVASYWVLAGVAPVVTALMIVMGTSMQPRTRGKLNMQATKGFPAMLASYLFALIIGRHAYNVSDQTLSQLSLIPVFLLCLISCLVATFWFFDVEFGRPHFYFSRGFYLQGMSILRTMWIIVLFIDLTWLKTFFFNPRWLYRIYVDIAVWLYAFAAAFIPRNLASLLWFLFLLRSYCILFYFWDDTTGETMTQFWSVHLPRDFLSIVWYFLCIFAPYSRDRYFIAAFGVLVDTSLNVGLWTAQIKPESLPKQLFHFEWPHGVEIIAVSIALCIVMRFQHVLPVQLHEVKFLRLGYLYELRRTKRMLVRCQDLPEAAFGNAAKVLKIIIISHRWLDKNKCDISTTAFPEGLRLDTLFTRLEKHYPTSFPGFTALRTKPLSTITSALWSATYASDDVLLFFDFASLPQIGVSPDGTLIDRTAEEIAVLKTALRGCGLLYTMFPVCVCPEVPWGYSSYMSSGWCFSEWEQAMLCGTLNMYSSDLLRGARPPELLSTIQKDLKEKIFGQEADRDIVGGILEGTYIRRKVHSAVLDQKPTYVSKALHELSYYNLKDTINFPVNSETLDTLLHVACKLPSSEIQAMLIDYGANPRIPNYRGEVPGMFFVIPRSWLPCLAASDADY